MHSARDYGLRYLPVLLYLTFAASGLSACRGVLRTDVIIVTSIFAVNRNFDNCAQNKKPAEAG